jgi:eukaryotic-like serine/threonine-protein kinase
MHATSRKAKEIFVAALKLAPDQWDGYLAEACGDDDELRNRVGDLLHANAEAGSFLESPASGPVVTVDEPIREGPGTIIGPYKLLEQIGEGGFGLVFMAEQQQPVHRKVAVKILKRGMDTRQVIARFEAERQALALMDHPNIARVLDAGETGSGRPHFVMELVRGIPITDYCDQNRLTTRERLELFVHVCQAVQHAHHKGIIHRDIKPSNVMVTLHDEVPVVKVIDFGIAKALGQQLTDKTLVTGFAQMIGTPLYMSPEQGGMSGLDVDTRSDIYSLGVLLYELLTGTTPFDKERLSKAGYDEMRRVIREEEPARPSTRLSTLGQAAATVSERRQSDPKRLSLLLRGELDWIVMKALDKDRNRRYETANGFAMDVQRYLADEPVQACPPSASYRIRKFTRRNRAAIWTTGVVAAALVIGTVVSVWQAVRATRAEVLADGRLKAEKQAREDADTNLQTARKATQDYFAVVCGIDILLRQGKHAEAEKAMREVLAAREKLAADSPNVPDYQDILARTHYELADLLRTTQRVSDADKEYRRAIDVWVKLARDVPAQPYYRIHAGITSGYTLADFLWSSGQYQEAVEALRQSVSMFEKLVDEVPSAGQEWRLKECRSKLGAWSANRAHAYAVLGQWDKAIADYTKVIELNPKDAGAWFQRASGCANLKQWDKALADYTKAIELDPKLAGVWYNRGNAYYGLKQWDQALADYTRAIELDPKHAPAHNSLGAILCDVKHDYDGAIMEFRQAIDLDPKSAPAHGNLGNALMAKNQLDEASAEYRKAIELDPKNAPAHYCLGIALQAKKQLDEAIGEYKKAIDLQPDYAEAHCNLASILRLQGQLPASLESFQRGHALGAKRKDWRYPSAQWVADAERLVGLEAKLPDVLAGKATPTDNRERLGLSEVCGLKRRHVAAARLYADAFTADPKLADDLKACHRYNAACYAALAAAGQGTDAGKLDDQEQSRLRQQALAWLRADLEQWSKGLEGGKPEDRQVMRATLEHWQGDTDLAGVRDPQALKKLSAEEQEAWRKLWADVAELLKKVADAK